MPVTVQCEEGKLVIVLNKERAKRLEEEKAILRKRRRGFRHSLWPSGKGDMENKEIDKMERQAVIFAIETENGVGTELEKHILPLQKSDFGAVRLGGWVINSKTSVHGKESEKWDKLYYEV